MDRRDKRNPFHPYLASLPSRSPEPACWSEALRRELTDTPLGVAVEGARVFVEACFDQFVCHLGAELGERLVPQHCLGSVEDLLWARGMCLSRAFPAVLAVGREGNHVARDEKHRAHPRRSDTRVTLHQSEEGAVQIGGRPPRGGPESDPGAPGCLLPLFDLLNHCDTQSISWVGEAAGVSFVAGSELQPWVEVHLHFPPHSSVPFNPFLSRPVPSVPVPP